MRSVFLRFAACLALAGTLAHGAETTAAPQPELGKWARPVAACLETLIERGRDRYGDVHSPLLMAVLNVDTLDAPQDPPDLDSLVRLEGRIHRRGEGGSNLWHDQPTLRAMYALSKRTGNPRYRQAADDCLRFALENCHKENGLLVWGSHIYWDCYRERAAGDDDGRGPHEILVHRCNWEDLYRINPQVVTREIDLIWRWHIHDHETGRHNRHDSGTPGADFPFSAGSFIEAFAFLHQATPDDTENLARAKLVTNWHWKHRNPQTNLIPFVPGNLLKERKVFHFYGSTFTSAVSGPHAAQLLRSYELTGDETFRQIATAYLLAYDKYGWDDQNRTFLGMLNLDGSPTRYDQVPDEMKSQTPGQAQEPDPSYSVPPIGPVDVWPTTIFPLDFPLLTAQTSLYAYELTPEGDEATRAGLLRHARRWGEVIEQALPADTGRTFRQTLTAALPEARQTRGTYAANYGRAISFFVHLYRATQDRKYLDLAEQLAGEAIEKLYVTTELPADSAPRRTYGIFKGHPAKRYYETVDGVGFLLQALLELDQPNVPSAGAF